MMMVVRPLWMKSLVKWFNALDMWGIGSEDYLWYLFMKANLTYDKLQLK